MNEKYTALVYCREEQIATKTGNDLDELYAWMLLQGSESIGDIRGHISENSTQKIVRTFCKSAIE